MSAHHPVMERSVEVLKALRSQWLTTDEVADHIGATRVSARAWLALFEAQGVIRRQKRMAKTSPFVVFSLCPEWGGQAE